jgi:membrane fusion protein, multidrug efflux system
MFTRAVRSPGGFRAMVQNSWLLIAVGVAAAFCTGCSTGQVSATGGGPGGGRGGKKGGGGDVPVTVAMVTKKSVPVEIQVIGNVEAYSTISVKAQLGGELTNVYFREGDFVKKGDPLFTIDPRPFEASLNQAVATVAKDEAALGQARANLARDSANLRYQQSQANRYDELFKGGIISKDQTEQLNATADATTQAVAADKAAIEGAQAELQAAKAAVDSSRVQLGYTNIKSPIDGRTGNLTIKQGNVVAANLELITITQIEPIYVTFSVPEAQLSDIKRYMAERKLEVRARLQDELGTEETGVLTFVDNAVDTTTGTIKLKGTFENHDRKLWPGQFVRVTLRLSTRPNAVIVPNQAIQTGQNGTFVYVVKPNRSVEVRYVTANMRVDQDMVVDKGLEPGETVVTEGQLRLAPDSRVVVRDGRGGPGGGRGGRGGRGRGDGKDATASDAGGPQV